MRLIYLAVRPKVRPTRPLIKTTFSRVFKKLAG